MWTLALLLASATVLLAGCRCSPGSGGGAGPAQADAEASAAPADAAATGPRKVDGYTYTARPFDLSEVSLKVVDLHMSRDLEGALTAEKSGLAIINGGFFDPEQRPLGLAMSEGVILSPYRRSTGGVLLVARGQASMFAVEDFTLPIAPREFGIQCLPRLVVAGERNVTRDDGKHTERTALCVEQRKNDGGALAPDRIRFVYARGLHGGDGPSLAQFSDYLATSGCRDALNLDGGPSAGLVFKKDDGQNVTFNPRGAVRHAIVAVSKTASSVPPAPSPPAR